jgi:hypothetical protein
VVLGAVTVVRFHIFAPVDERAHVAYVQEVAEHGRLPWLGRDVIPWQIEALNDDTYPRRSSRDPRRLGLAGMSYEAFQPPLYYVLAAPAFLVASNYRDKVLALRSFDLLLLLAAVAILALLAREVFGRAWRVPYCLALSVLLWPGVIVRAITVSNAALELPLVLLYVLALWRAASRRSPWAILAAGGLLGLCLLTQLTLVCLAPLLAVPIVGLANERRHRARVGGALVRRRGARATIAAGAALALALLMLAPWLASNQSRYGALIASDLAKRLQEPFLNPSAHHYGLGTLPSLLGGITKAALPQEWWVEYHKPLLGVTLVALPALLVLITILLLATHPQLLGSRAAALLAAPVALELVLLAAILVAAQWPFSFQPRFLHSMLPLLALFAAWAWAQARLRPGSLLAVAGAASFLAAITWIYMAGAYYFTNVGAALGIHAAS